jgi:hypothetical protein
MLNALLGLLVLLLVAIHNPIPADAGGPKTFYLTTGLFAGNEALQACDKGFHMASLWEIRETTNLSYDTSRGLTTDDSGSGPPAAPGWIRTGFFSTGQNVVGSNCNAWTSNLSSDNGTEAGLQGDFWDNAALVISPWIAVVEQCSLRSNVWCVEN